MATKAQVILRAGSTLGLIRPGQALKAEHDTRITTAYTEVYDDLKQEGLNVWASTGTVPDRVVPHLVSLMAFNCSEDLGVSDSRFTRTAGKTAAAKRQIRTLVTPEYESVEDPTDF